jgi:hypothetical protein
MNRYAVVPIVTVLAIAIVVVANLLRPASALRIDVTASHTVVELTDPRPVAVLVHENDITRLALMGPNVKVSLKTNPLLP